MLRATIEKRAILDEEMSHFKTIWRETKISKDKWELLQIFTDILEPFSFATQYVYKTVTPTITDVFFYFASMTTTLQNSLFASLSNFSST